MRRFLLLVVLALTAFFSLKAASFPTVHVSTPGTLEDAVYALDVYELDGLKVTGTLNSADLKTLRSKAGLFVKIPTLDISGITLQYDGEPYANGGDEGGDNAYGSAIYYLADDESCEDTWGDSPLGVGLRTWHYYSRSLAGLFCGIDSYDKVILPPLEELGPGIFRSATVKEVVLPSNLKTVGMKSFWDCEGLTTLKLPATVDSIGYMAFKYSSVTKIETSAKVKRIGKDAFFECMIPSFDFSGVESLGERCFYNSGLAGTLDLSNARCAEIPLSAFCSCDISSVKLGNHTVRICDDAFGYCKNLSNVSLPSTLERIGAGAFISTKFESTLKTENGVMYLGKTAYAINLPSGATSLSVKEGTKYLNSYWISDNRSTLAKVTLPSTLKVIEDKYRKGYSDTGAFGGCSALATVNLPEGLEIIGSIAFSGCTALTELKFPGSLLMIGEEAYRGCSGIKELTLPENVEIGRQAFRECSGVMKMTINTAEPGNLGSFPNLINLTIGKSVRKMHDMLEANELRKVVFEERGGAPLSLYNTFSGCKKLTTAELPEGLTYIGMATFKDCEKLVVTSLPSTLRYIGEDAFSNVGAMGAEISIPEHCDTIGIRAFENCKTLTNLKLHGGIKFMGSGCLNGTGITSIFFYKELAEQKWAPYTYDYRNNNNNLSNISFEEGTKAINLQFGRCPIRDIYVPDGVEEFNLVLEGMRTLEKLSLPSTCLKIGARLTTDLLESLEWRLPEDYTFEGDASANAIGDFFLYQSGFHWQSTGSREIHVPEGVGRIGKYAFYEFHDGNIYFPSTLKYLGEHAVKLAVPELNYVTFYSPEPPILEDYYSLASGTKIYVPRKFVDTYKAKWPNHAKNIYPIKQLEGITLDYDQVIFVMGGGPRGIGIIEYDEEFEWPITWTVDDPTIVNVSAYGGACNMTPRNIGSTIVRARCGEYEAQCRVFVSENHISTIHDKARIKVGETVEIGVDVPDYMRDIKVEYSVHSSSMGALDVEQISDNRCRVTGLKPGTHYVAYVYWPNISSTDVIVDEESGIDDVISDTKPRDVYNSQGILIKKDATAEDISNLPAGIYIIGGEKRLVR